MRIQRSPNGKYHTVSPPLLCDTHTALWLDGMPVTMSQLDYICIWGRQENDTLMIESASKNSYYCFSYKSTLKRTGDLFTFHIQCLVGGWRSQLRNNCNPVQSHDWGNDNFLSEDGIHLHAQMFQQSCSCMLKEINTKLETKKSVCSLQTACGTRYAYFVYLQLAHWISCICHLFK